MLGGAARRPLGRTTIHVALVLSLGVRAPRRGRRLLGRRRGAPASPLAQRCRRHRRVADRAARRHQGSRPARSSPATRRTPTASSTGSTPGARSARSSAMPRHLYGRAGLERAYDAELTGLAGDPLRTRSPSSAPTATTPRTSRCRSRYDLQKAAVAALGKQRGAVVMLDPRTGEVLALASTPTYDASAIGNPATAKGDLRGAAGRSRPAAAAAGHARALCAGLGVQDRDRGRRARLGRDHARHDVQAAAGGREERACWSTASGSATATTRRPARRRST